MVPFDRRTDRQSELGVILQLKQTRKLNVANRLGVRDTGRDHQHGTGEARGQRLRESTVRIPWR